MDTLPHIKDLISVTALLVKRRDWTLKSASTRSRTHDPTLTDEEWLEAFVRRVVTDGLDVGEHDERVFAARTQLLAALSAKRKSREARLDRARALIVEGCELFMGWAELVSRAESGHPCEFQLDRPEVWWMRGEASFADMRMRRLELERRHRGDALRKKMLEQRFELIGQESYRTRIKFDVMHTLATSARSPLHWVAQTLCLYTSPSAQLDPLSFDEPHRSAQEIDEMKSDLIQRWESAARPDPVAIPHQPLSTIPREANNLGLIASRGRSNHAALKFHQDADTGQLSLLAYDAKLVLKNNGVPDTYIKIPLQIDEGGQVDELTALLSQLNKLRELGPKYQHSYFQDVPRVIAGMFLAATQDASMGVPDLNPGEFWDLDTGRRLTSLIGLPKDHKRYYGRVADIRSWLSQITLCRTVVTYGKKKGRTTIEWEGPLVQRLEDKISITSEHSGEFRGGKMGVWRLAPALWRMRELESGAASFMLIDQRAFLMDTDAFNLYWCIVNRAYNGTRTSTHNDRVNRDGVFSPRAKTLYEWSGIERQSDTENPFRIRERMRDALESMVDHGLLINWSCSFLESDSVPFDSRVFDQVRVELQLPSSLSQYLPQREPSSSSSKDAPTSVG